MDSSETSEVLLKLVEQWRSTGGLTSDIPASLSFDDWLNVIAFCQEVLELEFPAIIVDEKLEPFSACPFCGGKDQVFLDNDKRDTGTSYGYYVKCSCGAEGAVGVDKSEAAALWNKRSETPAIAIGDDRRLSDSQNKAIAFLGTCSAQQQAQMMDGHKFRIETNE